jgi:hypothetical protein
MDVKKRRKVTTKKIGVNEKIFSIEEMKDILNRAVEETRLMLSVEYDKVLAQKLQEQYQVFAKFNEDYIHSQMQSRECSYLS